MAPNEVSTDEAGMAKLIQSASSRAQLVTDALHWDGWCPRQQPEGAHRSGCGIAESRQAQILHQLQCRISSFLLHLS
jgi:hypothetical protein